MKYAVYVCNCLGQLGQCMGSFNTKKEAIKCANEQAKYVYEDTGFSEEHHYPQKAIVMNDKNKVVYKNSQYLNRKCPK